MSISVQNYPPFRACRFCLSLQGGSVFADFDVDAEGRVFLRRISFDGYGCCACADGAATMSGSDSSFLIASLDRGTVGEPEVEALLRTFFATNAGLLWRDALASHGLL